MGTWSGRLMLSCVSIALNAATAGGIFTFPLLSPGLSTRLHLTQPQLTTIVLAGMAGQYPFSSIVGSAIDNIGPWACSLASSVFFFSGFGLFSLEIRKPPTSTSFRLLAFYFFLAGLGTVTSYFSALFCASKNFPNHSGAASGFSMAIFGLSPMILSLFASSFFTDSAQNLNISGFTAFLAILTGIVNAIGAINLRVVYQNSEQSLPTSPSRQDSQPTSETSPLLSPALPIRTFNRVWDVMSDYHFYILLFFLFCTLSSCEMVISNIGTISLALPDKSVPTLDIIVTAMAGTSVEATQVRILSLSNTISRIMAGTAADFISPVASSLPNGMLRFPRKHRISRVAFLCGSSILMVFAFMWMNLVVTTQYQISVFSILIGIAYGTIFTVVPSVASSVWGAENLARNFGLLTYAPFVGTPTFSYLYAFISNAAAGSREGVCQGKHCWTLTFYVCTGAAVMATVLSCWLWRSWRGKL